MPIYTKTGDTGNTSIYGGKRLSKADLRFEILGTIDELNSVLGFVAKSKITRVKKDILKIQSLLFDVGAYFGGFEDSSLFGQLNVHTVWLETEINYIDAKNKPLKNFILPGGTDISCYAHLARAVCRRLERLIVRNNSDNSILAFINRLSDFLFVIARFENKSNSVLDVIWCKQA